MLGRKLTQGGSFVCLRCRLQLAGAYRRLPFAAVTVSSTRIGQRFIGTYDSPSHADGPKSQKDGSPIADSDNEPSGDAAQQDERSATYWPPPAPPPRPPRPPRPQERTYTSRGQIVAPEQEGLDIDMLGKPGSAIVLREKRTRKKKRQLAELKLDAAAPETQVDPASLLADDNAAAESEDILVNIHELRPKDKRILSDKEFTQLKNTLVDGFTSAQLTRYIREYETIRQLSQEDDHTPELPAWVLEHQPWVPTAVNRVEGVEANLVGYITKGMAPKSRLAVRLMRNCWDLSNQLVLDRDGYLSLRLRDVEFSLLTLGNRRWLEGTQRAILAHVKEVRLIRESRLVSVMAPKSAAEAIVDRIHGVLSKARTSEFETHLVSPEPLEPGVLEEVGRLTNTVTRLDSSGKKVVVTWIHMPQRDENFENACETVLRFLRDAYGPKPLVSSTLKVVPEGSIHQGRYLPVLDPERKLPWQERFDKWERWTAAVPHWKAESKPSEGLIPTDILPFSLGDGKTVEYSRAETREERSELGFSTPGWSTKAQTDTSVVFGHVVFARQKTSADSGTPSPGSAPQLDTSLSRTFVPTLPALGSLNLPNNLMEEGLWHSTTVIRFVPSPDVSAELAASAPELELRIEADHVEVKALTSLRAVKETFIGDVLFPAAPVDARLVQRRYFDLPGPSIEQHVPSVITFITKSDLRPWAGKLSTPPVLLGVNLPRRLLISTTTTLASGTTIPNTNNNDGDNDPSVPVDYTLASIQVQRTVTAEYANLRLRYTSIQAGHRGGERAELSLEAVRVVAPPPEHYDSDVAQIVDEDSTVDEAGSRSRFVSHSKNSPGKSPALTGAEEQVRATILAKPVEPDEFLQAIDGIVHERSRLKWHAKRS
ncbi:hypothetical protein VTI28DRAFT_1165 [Corynascus sepedonium]